MAQRMLKHRAEQGVVDGDRRPASLARGHCAGDLGHEAQIDEAARRIRRGLDQDEADRALRHRLLGRGPDLRCVDAVDEADPGDAEGGERVADQRLGAAVERPAVQQHVARPQEGQQGRRDRRHAAGEDGAALGLVPYREAVLEDLEIGVVEAGIDEAGLLAHTRSAAPAGDVEEILALLRRLEHEGRGEEDRRLQGALGQSRRVAVAHHQRFRVQHVVVQRPSLVVLAFHGRHLRPWRLRGKRPSLGLKSLG